MTSDYFFCYCSSQNAQKQIGRALHRRRQKKKKNRKEEKKSPIHHTRTRICPVGLTLISDRQACIAEHFVKTATTLIHAENLISEVSPRYAVLVFRLFYGENDIFNILYTLTK